MLIVTRKVFRLNDMVTLIISGPSLRLVSTMRITSLGGRDVAKTLEGRASRESQLS